MSAALIAALVFTVALLVTTAYFMMGSLPLLILKHDTPVDARFIRGFFNVTDVLSEKRLVEKEYKGTSLSQHYGADEQMAAEIIDHVVKGAPLPVSTLDALEAGILALAMDDARRSRQVIDLRPIWDRYDTALLKKVA